MADLDHLQVLGNVDGHVGLHEVVLEVAVDQTQDVIADPS